jgi:DNA-binding response OmpR family regulator
MTGVLVVDDEPIVLDVMTRYLERDGHRVVTAETGDEARTKIESESPDLVLLDIMLPGETNGLVLCRWIRSTSDLPVILVTARGEEADRIIGLELGADDYVTKPFSPRELTSRVKAVLRRARSSDPPSTSLAVGPLTMDATTHDVACRGRRLRLTAKEFELLWFLASHPNCVFSRDQLMQRVWGHSSTLDTGTVTVHMRRLREKIEESPSRPRMLETVWGVGYRLRA